MILTNAGMKLENARSLIGKCLKDYDASDVADALLEARGTADPKAYALKLLASKQKKRGRSINYTAGAI